MKKEIISWTDIIKIPDPDTTLTIFLHVLIHFWRAETNQEYYKTNVFPQSVSDVVLETDHTLYQKPRFHLYEIKTGEWVGIWDETPYHVNFQSKNKTIYLDHGDFRHDFQLFLRSFLKQIKNYTNYYTSFDLLHKLLLRFPIFQWKCPVCCFYNDWSQKFIGSMLLHKQITIAPSSLLYLLTYQNKKLVETNKMECFTPTEVEPFYPIMSSALERFFIEFEKLYEQTSADPILMIGLLITILEKYTMKYSIDQIHEFEQSCTRDMKNILYHEYKFLQTKAIGIHHFPRDLMLIRDVFPIILQSFAATQDPSVCILFVLYNTLFEDKVLSKNIHSLQPLVVYHSFSNILTRSMTPEEINDFSNYHPLLRHELFRP